jgi:hypothetical protein
LLLSEFNDGTAKGHHFVRGFTYEGEPVNQVSTNAWYKALKRAGLVGF